MRRILTALVFAGIGSMAAAQSSTSPVVVELYTSQGCSSCPSADRVLEKLSARDDILPLSLHVDYWDYIGWADTFANPAFTERQKVYARTMGERMIYTPQMVINGGAHVVGNRPMDVADALNLAKDTRGATSLSVRLDGSTLRIQAMAIDPAGAPYAVQFVTYLPEETVKIKRGENAGKEVTYVNVVSGWQHVGEWDGTGEFTAAVNTTPEEDEHAVILQKANQGEVVAAARLR
ncbi:MAG: DUF1223 domain-containing protein [Donghicola eburneus]|nr:DUF1223 domain-containing protein [Donghicola eburneus]MCI5041246.1 DUF1223 domain-containing protein [Donghicola eburneus]